MNQQILNVAERVPCTEAEGPGRRYALWVQGCPLRCPGCCNPHMLEEKTMELMDVDSIFNEIIESQSLHSIEGITLVGGEPFAQAQALSELAERVQSVGLSVMVFSGFSYERLTRSKDEGTRRLLQSVDLLISGPYIKEKHTTSRRWIGSSNQEIHFLTERYSELRDSESGWDLGRNTLEIRLKGDQLFINGFPHPEFNKVFETLMRKSV